MPSRARCTLLILLLGGASCPALAQTPPAPPRPAAASEAPGHPAHPADRPPEAAHPAAHETAGPPKGHEPAAHPTGRAAHPAPHAEPPAHAGAPARHPEARSLRHPARPPVHAPAPVVAVPAPTPAPAAALPDTGSNTGLPVPRFASLRTDDVNLRAGPGTRYPIEWVYKRRDLPVQIEREFDIWRLVRDAEGVQGWVHQATLGPRRTAVVVGAERVLRAAAGEDAAAVARLKPGVIVRVRACAAGSDWCELQVGDYRGFLRRADMWGTLPGEVIQ